MANAVNKQFIIFNINELSKIKFTEVLETSLDTTRKSIDGTKTFVKWEGNTPECLNALTTAEGPYTLEEITAILESEQWSEPIT
jgi:hypothetical protein